MLTGINHLTLAVSDLERSFSFYTVTLGLAPRARWNRGAYLLAGDCWLCLAVDTPRPARDYSHLAFSVAQGSFHRARQRLIEAGLRQWKTNSSEGNSLYFLDPDGHKLELHEGTLATRLKAMQQSPYSDMQMFACD